MKKIFLSAIMLIGFSLTSQAQEISKNALGFRFGDNSGLGAEITYQKALTENKRLELDLGLRNSNNINAIKITGLHQWLWNIDGAFNWYAGAGAGIGNYSANGSGGTFAFVTGDIGIEYGFEQAPILISLDLRPEIGGHGYYENNYGSDIALGLKYKF